MERIIEYDNLAIITLVLYNQFGVFSSGPRSCGTPLKRLHLPCLDGGGHMRAGVAQMNVRRIGVREHIPLLGYGHHTICTDRPTTTPPWYLCHFIAQPPGRFAIAII